MNKGIITGVVRNETGYPEKKAVVCLARLRVGHNNRLSIFNADGGTEGRIHIVYSDKNGRYKVPFLWNEADIGEFSGPVTIEIFALHATKALRGDGTGRLFTAPNIDSLVTSILPTSLDTSDLADMKGFKLPGAFKSILTPKLSIMDMVAFGYCNIWLGVPLWSAR